LVKKATKIIYVDLSISNTLCSQKEWSSAYIRLHSVHHYDFFVPISVNWYRIYVTTPYCSSNNVATHYCRTNKNLRKKTLKQGRSKKLHTQIKTNLNVIQVFSLFSLKNFWERESFWPFIFRRWWCRILFSAMSGFLFLAYVRDPLNHLGFCLLSFFVPFAALSFLPARKNLCRVYNRNLWNHWKFNSDQEDNKSFISYWSRNRL